MSETSKECTIGLAQCCHPQNETVLEMVERWIVRAKNQGVQLLVFPESLMTRYEIEIGAFRAAAQSLDGPYASSINEMAARYGMWIVYTVNEESSEGKPFNTVVLVDDSGCVKSVYRKVHLFDTDFTKESDRMMQGCELSAPVDTPFGKIGLSICYDLRFPEVARTLALQGCQILINPAAWVDGRLKADQWKTLLQARAIENEIFVCGVSRVDEGYIGQSCIVGPDGVVHAAGGVTEELVVATISCDDIDRVRRVMPCLDHRMPEVYSL
ncbi:MAG: carbon-nitrogen hydrolase family protein [Anaerotardibacter sp.]